MDMKGKHVVITGPTAGIGRSAALNLAARGAELTLLCQNADKGAQLQRDIESRKKSAALEQSVSTLREHYEVVL